MGLSVFTLVRFCFVTFLVLLQLAAPLIHAHKNEQFNVGYSFHLPEFEQVNSLLEHNATMISSSYHEGEMVTVSAGVKENQRRHLPSEDNLRFFIIFSLIYPLLVVRGCLHSFFVQAEPVKRFLFLSLGIPRAPPFSSF